MAGLKKQESEKAEVETILAEFDAKEDLLASFCVRTKALIEAILQDAGIRSQSVQFRVKTKRKLREKYLDPAKHYTQLEDITDLAGLRIITYYEDEVDQIAEIVKREFDVDLINSVDKRQVEPDRFGYSALNYICRHSSKRTSDVEYKKFAGVRCEIRITSVLRHAWSEIEHEWYDLKEAYPEAVKRRFYRTAALLELAESEFLDIRKQRTSYQRSVAVRVEAKVPDLPIDAVSLKAFVQQEPLVHDTDRLVADAIGLEFVDELPDTLAEFRYKTAATMGFAKLRDLRDALIKYGPLLSDFAHFFVTEIWPKQSTPRPQVSVANQGVSIYYLALFLASLQGKDRVSLMFASLDIFITWDIDPMVSAARGILEKHT